MNEMTGNILQLTMKLSFYLDRYVMIGNHRDSWIFGAADPSSGTSIMMEIARVLGMKIKDGD